MAAPDSCGPLNLCATVCVYLLLQTQVSARGSAEGSGGHDDYDDSTGTLTLHNITALLLAFAVIILIVTGVSTLVCCVCFIRQKRRERTIYHEFPLHHLHSHRQASLKSITPSVTSSPTHSQCHHLPHHYSTNQMTSSLPYSKSVLTALYSSGRQTGYRVSQSNPELTIMQCHQKFDSGQHLDESISAQDKRLSHNEADSHVNQMPTSREDECYPVALETPTHHSVMCTSISSLPSNTACAIVSLGRIRAGWQH